MKCNQCQAGNDDSAGTCFHCGAPIGAIVKGTVIGARYEVLRPLGEGGMGMVYLVHDRQLDERIALKVMRTELAGLAPQMAKRFLWEIKLARRVVHKNVCQIFDYGQDGSRAYIAMAYVDGVDLRTLLRQRGALPPREAFDLSIQVAEALEAIHEEGIVHRDLKTLNIMKDGKGQARVMDFGLAKHPAAGSAADLTRTGDFLGSPHYMSPERWEGREADARADIYALGVVAYELFTGHRPFEGDFITLRSLHVYNQPPVDDEPALSAPVRAVLKRALAKDPAARFPSAREMADALRAARTEDPERTLRDRGDPELDKELAGVRALLATPGQATEVEARLKQLTARHPHDPRPWQVQGEFLARCQRHAEALAAFERGIKADALNGRLQYYAGVALQNLGRHAESAAALQKALSLQLEPDLHRHASLLLKARR